MLISAVSFAQNTFKISGFIKDKNGEPLFGASVSLRTSTDEYIGGDATIISGHFQVNNIPSGMYKVTVSYIGYLSLVKNINIISSDVDLGTIQLDEDKAMLSVQIKGRAAAIQQKDDTTEYNAGSYKVNSDANADDLLKKMPGMDLSSGTPKAQGETITKVLVDGKPFFGDDATSSLKNIPAEIIDKIQLYDEKSEQSQFTGFDDGNTTKTVNILTKAGRKEGVFGKAYAGYGYDDKYNAGGNVNYFKGDRRISLIGQTNNVNIQNFDAQDLVGVSGVSGRSRGGGRGGSNNNFMVNNANGISKTNAIGLNYSDKWGKKIDVTGSYFFNNSSNLSEQELNRIFVLPSQSGQYYTESSKATTNNFNHRFNLRLTYTIDSFNSILFIPKLSFQEVNSQTSLLGQTFQGDNSILNKTINNFSNDNNSTNLSSMFLYRHKFKKIGRTLSLWANGGQNSTVGAGDLMAQNTFVDTLLNENLNQQIKVDNDGWNINTNLNYTEPLTKKSGLQAQYGFRFQNGNSNKRTYNFNDVSGDYSLPDSLLSNNFKTKYITQTGGLGYRYSDSNWNFNAGVNYQAAQLTSERILPQAAHYSGDFTDFLPYGMLRYKFSKLKSLQLFYRTSTDAPSVTQLQDVIDNSNPLQLTSGNPNLKEDYQHNLRFRYTATNPGNSTTFFAMLSGNYIRDYIGRSTLVADSNIQLNSDFILPKGAQFIQYQNMEGYWNINSFATYGMPVDFLKSNLNFNAQLGFVATPGLINGNKNLANNTNAGLGFTLGSNISENIDFTLSSTGSYNWVKNSLNINSDNTFYNQNTSLSLNYVFWKGLVFHTDLNHQFYSGLSAGYNQNFLLWNMSIGKKLFKNQQGEIKLYVFDALGQNNSIQRTVSEIYSEDVQTNVLKRYLMLTFTYNLRFFKGNATMKDAAAPGEKRPWE